QNDVTLKMPAFEWVHVQLHQQKGMISLSPPTICNSAGERIAKTLTELKLPDIKVANNKLLIDVSVSMPAAIALDIILPHMSKSIFTEKLAANFGLAAFPLLN
ncbi:hypothetical protein ACSJM9_26035, partial [Klebsiella pneumoniae]|uniref:hypothetical protein n=1 Tax=Klebsiella pneumoniae TaxID=573 RepID=UPI003EE2BA76